MRPWTRASARAIARSGWSEAWPWPSRITESVKRSIWACIARNRASGSLAFAAACASRAREKASSVALSYPARRAGSRAWSMPIVAFSIAGGEALPVLGERLQDLEALPHLVDREQRALREGPTRQLEGGRARVLRPLRAELVEDEGDDADQAVVGTRRPAGFAGRLHRRRGGRPRARLGRTRRLLAFRLHEAERLHGAGFAVLEDLHLVGPQVLHEPAGLVADDEIEQDEIGPRGEDRRRGRFLGPPEGRGRQEEESRARQGQFHRFNPSRCRSSIACRRNSQARFVPRGHCHSEGRGRDGAPRGDNGG